jgi:hypothetical protein
MSRLIVAGLCGMLGGVAAAGEQPSPKITQFVLFDGETGAARDYWNRGISLAWRNTLGDWRDAQDKPQGPAPWATLIVPVGDTPRQIVTDITTLVKHWLASGNTGLLLRAGEGGCEFASREHADNHLRPTLAVVTAAGTCVCPCTADAALNASTYKSQGRQPSFAVTRPGSTAVAQFDLSGVRGKVQSATLTLHCVKARTQTAIEVQRLDAPVLYAGGGAPQLGLAQDYPHDQGIAAHRDVLFATDFAGTSWREKYFTEGQVLDPTFAENPMSRSTCLRGQFVKGEVGSCALDYRWSTHRQSEPEEVYFRYYVLLEKDFGSTVDGNKMPGLAGRYGRWNGRYYEVVCGNGGSRTTGLVSQTERGKVLCGWSMRGLGHQKPADDNPYRELTAVGTYAYHADQAGHFGDHWRWGTAVLEHDRWYCIEQYVKVNSVEGPFDALGNGTGRRDGVLRVWLDGQPVFEKTDIRFRHHPAIKIDEVWLNWYHGGTQPAAATHHYRMANVVVARAYIGPLAR